MGLIQARFLQIDQIYSDVQQTVVVSPHTRQPLRAQERFVDVPFSEIWSQRCLVLRPFPTVLSPAACLKSLSDPNDGRLQEFFPIRKSGLNYAWSRLTRGYESSLIRLLYGYLTPGTLLEYGFAITFHTVLMMRRPVEIQQPISISTCVKICLLVTQNVTFPDNSGWSK